ncbi:MAG: methionyl-tRNA formyltransferase [Bdellovibrionota bacterium]
MYQKDKRKKIVFLGTPLVAAVALDALIRKAAHVAKVVLVVTQPPSRSSRSHEEIRTPVHLKALENGIPVLTPQTAKDVQFLSDLAALEPDLCVTAAYGNYLPTNFLNIPKHGTVNIHPSLLPLYRGAAPVQRSIENGDKVTGVTLLYTEKAMDAGPIVASENFVIDDKIKAPELLNILFSMGAELLVKNLKFIFQENYSPVEQKHENATHAKKIAVEESILDFNLPARMLHNKVRAFAGWPGTKMTFGCNSAPMECKIITTEVANNEHNLKPFDVFLNKESIDICCGDGNILQIKEIQPVGKKVLSAKDFQNGIKNKLLKIY